MRYRQNERERKRACGRKSDGRERETERPRSEKAIE